jgi:leader peptidase (prepilin peptidase) / N-methyltransferase
VTPNVAPDWLQALFSFVFGLCIGSFLNVVIFRLPRSKSIVHPSSRCGFCKCSISPWMNIPLLGFFFSRGLCSKCGTPFSSRYPMVEFLTGMLFVAVWAQYGWSLAGVVFWLFVSVLIAMSFIDLDFRIIPDRLSIGGWAIAICLAALQHPEYPITLMQAVIGSAVGYGSFFLLSHLFYFLTHEEGLGGGDVKLMGLIGAVTGIEGALTSVMVGAFLGSIVGVFFIVALKKTKQFPIPFGPFLAVGSLVSVFRLDEFFWG